MFEMVLKENKNEHFGDSSTCLLESYGTSSGFSGGRRGCASASLSFTSIVWSLQLGRLSARFTTMTGELVVDDARLILKILLF